MSIYRTIQSPRPLTPAIPEEGTRITRVMIRCTESGEPVPAGSALGAVSFDGINLTHRCPHCGHKHAWSAEEAWIEDVVDARSP
jgi:hypothetical protein